LPAADPAIDLSTEISDQILLQNNHAGNKTLERQILKDHRNFCFSFHPGTSTISQPIASFNASKREKKTHEKTPTFPAFCEQVMVMMIPHPKAPKLLFCSSFYFLSSSAFFLHIIVQENKRMRMKMQGEK
jgi:hypothetical protein